MSTEDLTVQYVLGELPPDEARRFEAQVATDGALAAEVRRLRAALGLLPYATLAEPPPDLRSRIMAGAETKRRERTATAAVAPAARQAKVVPLPKRPRR